MDVGICHVAEVAFQAEVSNEVTFNMALVVSSLSSSVPPCRTRHIKIRPNQNED